MISTVVLLIGGAAAALALMSGSSKKTNVSAYAQRLKDSHYRGVDRPTQGPQQTTWNPGASVTSPAALQWVTREISLGRTIWHDSTLYGSGMFVLYSTPDSSRPSDGDWHILATSADLHALNVAAGGGFVEEKTPIEKPSDLPRTVPEGGVVIPVPIPAQGGATLPSSTTPSGPPKTGIPDVDEALRSPDTSPATLRAIATSLRQNGRAAMADAIDAYAEERYAQLRASHTILGGTPWRVRPGDIAWNLEKYYTGTNAGGLAEITRINKGKPFSKWTVGSTWLLPLSWNVEGKVPYTPKPVKAAPKAKPPTPPIYNVPEPESESVRRDAELYAAQNPNA